MNLLLYLMDRSSFDNAFVNPSIPALDTEYITSSDAPTIPHADDIFIMQPLLLDIIFFATSCDIANAE